MAKLDVSAVPHSLFDEWRVPVYVEDPDGNPRQSTRTVNEGQCLAHCPNECLPRHSGVPQIAAAASA